VLDFNSVESSTDVDLARQRDEIRSSVLDRIESVLAELYPAGKRRKSMFLVGDVLGSPGDSLEVVLDGEKAGLWTDRATGAGGDLFDLIAEHFGIDIHGRFPEVLAKATELAGRAPVVTPRPQKKDAALDDLGPATAKWDYHDAHGQLMAVVYRYDPPGRRKEFRPWDARRRKLAPPDPRPLYNQPAMLAADSIVLVEGEKCAQALIGIGIVATTAMHGANAPVDKTDWSPLAGKSVLIWPDRDKPGWEYASNASQAVLAAGARECAILFPPEDMPEGWDAADAIADGFDAAGFICTGPRMLVHVPSDADQDRSDADTVTAPDDTGNREQSVWGSDDALALTFTRHYHRDWRYVAAWGKWLMWDGQRWRAEGTLAATHLMRHVCRQTALKTANVKVAAKLSSSSTVSGVERLARTDRRHAATTDEWDADLWLINTPGGVVDLRSGRMRPNDRADRMTKITTATLVAGGTSPNWMAFLDQATGGDPELVGYLQRLFGYCLTGSTQEHTLHFLYGTGANGKSVFVNTLFTILGDYAVVAPMDTFMESRGDRHPTELAGLRGARFVAATETEQGRRWNESKVKEMTGGDRIAARFMHQDFFVFTPQFKLLVAGNHKPAIRNIDEAMRRRMHLIPFTITVPPAKRDQQLQARLLTERNAIFAWGVQGCIEWQQIGLRPPKCVMDATDEYFEAEDALGRWLDECCLIDPNFTTLTAALFADWKRWAEAAGEFAGSQRRFSDLLLTRGLQKWRNTAGVRGFQGISVKNPSPPAYAPYADQ